MVKGTVDPEMWTIVKMEFTPAPMVYPFGAAVATLLIPTMPLAPGRLTRTKGVPRTLESSGSMMRIAVSAGPPGVAGTMTWIGCEG
jgi:hypothetical protein